jgi:formylmethanofuran dehydrogenase subunit E
VRRYEYDCDKCGAETPDGNGYYYKGERLCRECAELAKKNDEGKA